MSLSCLSVYRIYPIEFEIKNTTYTARSSSPLDLHLNIDKLLQRLFQFSHCQLSIYM